MNRTLGKYRDYIILAGLLVGGLYIFEVIPATTDIMDLNENVKYIYLGVIVLAGFTYYDQFFNKVRGPQVQRKVEPTMRSSSEFRKRMAAQRGHIQRPPVPQQPIQEAPAPQPSPDMMRTFGRE